MKKILLALIMMICLSTATLGLEQYTGMPSTPYIIFGQVDWNSQLLSGVNVQLTNTNTGFTQTIVTDGSGYWQTEATSWLTNAAARPPVMYGDTITVKVLDGCGTGDVCEKSFQAFSGTDIYEYKVAAKVDLSITGTLSCPPQSCPSCGGGGSSGGSGGYCSYTEEMCLEKFPVEDVVCDCGELAECPAEKVCPITSCPSCPEVKECDESTDNPEGLTGGQWLIFILSLSLVGGGSYYGGKKLNSDEISKIRNVTYRVRVERDGDIVEEHRHAGLRSYHSINTSHRESHEKHPKGEKFPKYEKDVDGVYKYVP